jgi:hypothetical protein
VCVFNSHDLKRLFILAINSALKTSYRTYDLVMIDSLLKTETMVAIYKMTNDTSPQTIYIEPKSCLDLSGQCPAWKRKGECNRSAKFMKQYCRLSCRYCSEKNDTVKMLELKKSNKQRGRGDEF